MLKFKTKRNKIIAALFGELFVLSGSLMAVLFTLTFAWFASNREVSSQGIQIKSKQISNLVTISTACLKYDGVSGAQVIPVENEYLYIEMPEYDMIFTDKNVNTPIIIRTIIYGFADDQDIKITIPCYQNLFDSENKFKPYLSNVCELRAGFGLTSAHSLDTSFNNIESTKESIYRGAIEALSTTTPQSFVQYNNNTYSKERTIEFVFTSSDYSSQIQQGVIEDELVDYVVLNLEFNYASSLVETYAGFYTVENMPTEISTDIGTITIE